MRTCLNKKEGGGLVKNIVGAVINKSIALLPVKLHIPGCKYCGPWTKMTKYLQRGDPGINKLDAACKEHDIADSNYSDSINRAKAAKRGWESVKNNTSIGEKAAAWALTNIMKAKSRFGGGVKKTKKNCFKEILKIF